MLLNLIECLFDFLFGHLLLPLDHLCKQPIPSFPNHRVLVISQSLDGILNLIKNILIDETVQLQLWDGFYRLQFNLKHVLVDKI